MTTDFHTHIFPPDLRARRERWLEKDATFADMFADPAARMASAEDLIRAMDEDGVRRAIAMGMGWTDKGLARESNDYIIEAARRCPDRIIPFCSVNPAWGGDAAASETDRCARLGARGIGELHPDTQGFDLAADVRPILEVADEFRLAVTVHSSEPVGHLYPGKGDTTPRELMKLIETSREYPGVKIICAHWGGGLPFYALMPEVRDALANVWFDTAATPFLYSRRVFSVAAALVGTDKILPASDFPLMRFARIRRQIRRAGMNEDDLGKPGPFAD